MWRRGRDSNSRRAHTLAGFQDRCIQPLCHPSATGGNLTGKSASVNQSFASSRAAWAEIAFEDLQGMIALAGLKQQG